MTAAASPRGSRLTPVLPFLELLGLSGLAIAQPIFEVFRDGADIFVAYGASRLDVLLFALIVALGVPVIMFAVELLAGLLGERWRRLVHAGSVCVLLGTLATQVLKRQTDLGWKYVLVAAVAVAVAGAVAVWRWSLPRLFLRFLSVAALAFVALFLFASPITALVVPSGSVAAADVRVGNPAPVVFLTFDELPLVSLLGPDDRVDPELFPNFAALAGDATLYRNETTVAPVTPEAVPALLTGKYPENAETLPVVARHPENLFTLLGDTYRINASEGWTQLCPRNLCGQGVASSDAPLPRLLGDARLVWRQKASPKHAEQRFQARAETFRLRRHQVPDFVDRLDDRGDGRPTLDFLHVVLPHVAFEYAPSGQQYVAPGFPRGSFFGGWFDQDVADAAREQHLLQLAYTDRLLGTVLDRLREIDRYDDALVVVTADHGAAFTKGSPNRGISKDNFHEIMWTPLLIKAPRQSRGVVDDTPVRSTDILPTVASMLDVDLPWRVDGRPIRPGRRPDGPPRLFDFFQNELRPNDGQFVTVDGEAGFRRVLAAPPVRTAEDDDLALYRHGAYGDLVGREVRDLRVGEPLTVPGQVDHRDWLVDVDADGQKVPAYLSGEVTVPGPDPSYAIAVNGVVGGWSHGYLPGFLPANAFEPGFLDTPRPRDWWTMVPPELLRDGSNRVDVFRIDGTGPSVVLRPLRLRH